MISPIVVGVDPRREDPAPLALASLLAELTERPLLAIAAYPEDAFPSRGPSPEYNRTMREEADAGLVRAKRHLPEDAVARAVAGTSRARALTLAAEQAGAAILVVGATHHGPLGRLVSGSVTDHVLHGARVPVAVAPRDYQAPATGVRRVGAAFIDTPEGRAALRAAGTIATRADASLRAITVVAPIDWVGIDASSDAIARERDAASAAAEKAARAALAELDSPQDADTVVVLDGTGPAVAELSGELDLLVCGSRGYGPARTVLLGSVSHALARHARCPLIVIPRDPDDALGALFVPAKTAATSNGEPDGPMP